MEILSKSVLALHIVAGFLALTLFWLQARARKGDANHRRLGNAYVKLMWVVVISAVALCINNYINGRNVIATFLVFIALITAKPLWLGVAVLKAKKEKPQPGGGLSLRSYRRADLGFNLAIVACGIAMIVYGIYLGGKGMAVLLMIFGGIGLMNGFDLRSSILEYPNTELSGWMKQHIVSMGGSGIAAHTAFLVFGANRFLPDSVTQSYWSIVPWLMPTLVGLVLIRIAVSRYQPKNTKHRDSFV